MIGKSVGHLFATAALLALAGCQEASGQGACPMVHLTDLPLRQHRAEFYVTILINGQAALMTVDTSSEMSVSRRSAAARLGMHGYGADTATMEGVGGSSETRIVYANEVRLGETHGSRLQSLALDELPEPSQVDGVLGMNFLSTLDIDLDFWVVISASTVPWMAATGRAPPDERSPPADAPHHFPRTARRLDWIFRRTRQVHHPGRAGRRGRRPG